MTSPMLHLTNGEPSVCCAISNVRSSDHVDPASDTGVVHTCYHLITIAIILTLA